MGTCLCLTAVLKRAPMHILGGYYSADIGITTDTTSNLRFTCRSCVVIALMACSIPGWLYRQVKDCQHLIVVSRTCLADARAMPDCSLTTLLAVWMRSLYLLSFHLTYLANQSEFPVNQLTGLPPALVPDCACGRQACWCCTYVAEKTCCQRTGNKMCL